MKIVHMKDNMIKWMNASKKISDKMSITKKQKRKSYGCKSTN